MLGRKASSLKIGRLDFLNPRAKLGFVKKVFTEVAPTYALLTRMLSFGRDQAWKNMLLRKLPEIKYPRPKGRGILIRKEKRHDDSAPSPHQDAGYSRTCVIKTPQCLDLACGTGDLSLALARKYPRGEIIGLDINPTMLALARKRPAPQNIRFVQKDMNHTGFRSGRFDIITGGYALRNAPHIEEALREIYRLLKPGGFGAFLDFSKSPKPARQAVALFFLGLWGGLWGLILHGNPDIYAYIAASLKYFPDRAALATLLSQTGFTHISSRMIFFGFLEIITVHRPGAAREA